MGDACRDEACGADNDCDAFQNKPRNGKHVDVAQKRCQTSSNNVMRLFSKRMQFKSVEFYRKPSRIRDRLWSDCGPTGADNPCMHVIIVLRSDEIDF